MCQSIQFCIYASGHSNEANIEIFSRKAKTETDWEGERESFILLPTKFHYLDFRSGFSISFATSSTSTAERWPVPTATTNTHSHTEGAISISTWTKIVIAFQQSSTFPLNLVHQRQRWIPIVGFANQLVDRFFCCRTILKHWGRQ